MTTLSDLCAEPLAITAGVPLGIPGYDSYRFAVQLALVSPANILPFVLGTSMLGGPRWEDVTDDVQGLTWGRGGQPAQRPIAGELQMRLLNLDCRWCPWQNGYYGPGTLLRVVIGNGVSTKPQFTGLTQSWIEASQGQAGGAGYQWVDVTAWESLSLLSESNDNALAGVVGGGETLTQRVDRLLTQAEWQFGYATDPSAGGAATFQATDLAQDVASELFRTVDSCDATVVPAKNGSLLVWSRGNGSYGNWNFPYEYQNPDTFTTANDDDRILSSVDLARVGGTVVTFTNTGVAGRYQKRSTNRVDLMTVAEAADADLARVAAGMLARANESYRPVSFACESGQGASVSNLMIEADLTDRITLDAPLPMGERLVFDSYSICGFNYDVTVAAAGTYWRATVYMDIESDSSWTVHGPDFVWDESFWDGGGVWS